MKLFFTFHSNENIERLHHFFNHYRKLGVTNFYAVYHTYGSIDESVLEYVMTNAMVIKIWDGKFNEHTKIRHINEGRLKFSKYGEWSFTVDCDEFIDITTNQIEDIITSKTNYCRFGLIDRFSEPPLKEVVREVDINETFPLYSNFTREVLKGETSKISLSTREVVIGLGYHDVLQTETLIRLVKHPINVWVNHFKWVGGLIEEIDERIINKFEVVGPDDPYLGECKTLLGADYGVIKMIEKPLSMKLLFIVWSQQNFNLMRLFFEHYRGLGVTDFYCIFHTYGMENSEIYDYVSENATIVHHWDEPYTTEWECRLKNQYKREITDDENEWLWVVDADEFVEVSTDFIRNAINSESNYVDGWLVDRFSPDGLIVPSEECVFMQFPIRTFYTRFTLNGSASKIPLTRSYVILGVGHHVVLNELYDFGLEDERVLVSINSDEDEWVEVAHIKWHSNLLEEIYLKFTKTMDLCRHSAKELGTFVLDYLYKKDGIMDMIKDDII